MSNKKYRCPVCNCIEAIMGYDPTVTYGTGSYLHCTKCYENTEVNFQDENTIVVNTNKPETMRKYLPTLSELIDRLSIVQLKEVFIPEHKEEYAKEIKDICYDINIILGEMGIYKIDAETIRAIIVLSQMNLHIWHNESEARKGINAGENLRLTHSLNGIRNTAKNKIQEIIGGRKDYKTDCLASDHSAWEISW